MSNATNSAADDSSFIDGCDSHAWPSVEETVDQLDAKNNQHAQPSIREVFDQVAVNLPAPGEPGASVPATLGRFRLIREVGRGRFGIVYLARDDQLDRDVAVKVARAEVAADEKLRQRFAREAELAASLDHKGIVPIHEVGVEGPWLYIVMGFCDGQTLAEWKPRNPDDVSPAMCVRLAKQIADAIAHGHSRGVVHRDLKPSNIGVIDLVSDENPSDVSAVSGADRIPGDPDLRVYDFGLSCGLEFHLRDTRTSLSVGTPLYMAPEQLRGSNVSPAADVYSIGTMLYELLTGRCPFEAATQPEVLHRLWHEEPEPPRLINSSVNRELNAICLKALAKRPEDRYADAAEFSDDLLRWLRGRPTNARAMSWGRRFELWSERPNRLREAGAIILTQHLVLPAWSLFGQLGPQSAIGSAEGFWMSPQLGGSALIHVFFFYVGYRLWANRPALWLMRTGFVIAFLLVPLHLGRGLGWIPTSLTWYDTHPDMRWLIYWLMSLTAGIDLIAIAIAIRSDRRRRIDTA